MNKKCETCKESKPLEEFFFIQGAGSSAHCKKCHADAKVPHGYGWYGNKYTSPDNLG